MNCKTWAAAAVVVLTGAMALGGCAQAGASRNTEPTQAGRLAEAPGKNVPATAEPGANSPWIGRAAPALTLTDSEGKAVSLAEYRGKWVVVHFFPKEDTPGCACEATGYTNLLFELSQAQAAAVAVSDNTVEDNKYYRTKYSVAVPVLSDAEGKTLREWGVWNDRGAAETRVRRATFLVDPKGKIAWHWGEVTPREHVSRVREKVEELAGKGNAGL